MYAFKLEREGERERREEKNRKKKGGNMLMNDMDYHSYSLRERWDLMVGLGCRSQDSAGDGEFLSQVIHLQLDLLDFVQIKTVSIKENLKQYT